MPPFVLRPFQRNDLEQILAYVRARPLDGRGLEVLIRYCTAAGKTGLGLCIGSRLLTAGLLTHYIIAAPTDVIVDSFNMNGYSAVTDASGTYKPLRVDDDTKTKLAHYLTLPNPGFALRLTHAAITAFYEHMLMLYEVNPRFAEGKGLFLDESHHSRLGNIIRQARDLFVAGGGLVFNGTATPKDDNFAPGIFTVSRTMPEQMVAGFAPSTLLNEIVSVEGDSVTDGDDIARPVVAENVAQTLVAHMNRDAAECGDVLKAIVRIKSHGTHNRNHDVIACVAAALHKDSPSSSPRRDGRRVFVASDAHVNHPDHREYNWIKKMNQEVIDAIRYQVKLRGWDRGDDAIRPSGDLSEVRAYERRITLFADSCVDVIIGIHTLVEGFDWPLCSHGYLLGVPRELDALIQLLGRVMRLRTYEDYPAMWKDSSKLVLLTGRDARIRAEDAQAAQVLAICGYLATFQQWSILGALSGVIKALKIEGDEDGRERLCREIHRTFDLPQEKSSTILLYMAQAIALFDEYVNRHIDRPSRALTYHGKTKITLVLMRHNSLAKDRIDIDGIEYTPHEIKQAILVNSQAACAQLTSKVEVAVSAGVDLMTATHRALQELIEEFKNETRTPVEGLLHEASTVLAVDAAKITDWGLAVRKAIDPVSVDARPAKTVDPIGAADARVRAWRAGAR